MNLALTIMRDIEENCGRGIPYNLPFDKLKRSQEDLEWHFCLIVERGLAVGDIRSNGCYFLDITPLGHDFLDNARIPIVWDAVVKAAEDAAFGIFLHILEEAATQYAI